MYKLTLLQIKLYFLNNHYIYKVKDNSNSKQL